MTRFIPSETILPSLTRTAPKTPPVQYSSDARCDNSMARRRNFSCSMFSCGFDISRFVTRFGFLKKVIVRKYHDYWDPVETKALEQGKAAESIKLGFRWHEV